MKNHTQFSKGFTLVELAVVLTIVALLIGGVLKGQEMIEDARVVATVAQVHSYESAMMTFKKAYGDMPGDMPNAESRLEACSNCNPTDDTQAGDGWVGNPSPHFTSGTMGTNTNMAAVWQSYSGGGGVDDETRLFWSHLYAAGMTSDVNTVDISRDAEFGITLPAAKIGGGFLVGSIASSSSSSSRMEGVLLALVAAPEASTGANEFLLTPLRAAQIDRKMDDGFPTSGKVQDASGFRRGLSVGMNGEPVMLTMNKMIGGGTSSPCRALTQAMEAAGIQNEGYLEGEETEKKCNMAFRIGS